MNFAVSDPLDVLRKQVISLLPLVIEVDNDPTGVNPVVLTYPENYKNVVFIFSNPYDFQNGTIPTIPIDVSVSNDSSFELGNQMTIQWNMINTVASSILSATFSDNILFTPCGFDFQPLEIPGSNGSFCQRLNYNGDIYQGGDTC